MPGVKNGVAKRFKRNKSNNNDGVACCYRAFTVRKNRVCFTVFLAALLLLISNAIWLYGGRAVSGRGPCIQASDVWGLHVNSSSTGPDYQRVRGSGFRSVPVPIPVPNDTVLAGPVEPVRYGDAPRFMTIGISTVWRKENYIYKTLDSIIRQTSEEEKLDVVVIILLADANPQLRVNRTHDLETRYGTHLSNGFMVVIQPPDILYPNINFQTIRRTYKDSVARVQWRTKQVLDFAFLFWYAYTRNESQYFLFLEDDIISAKHFVSATKDFVDIHKDHYWIALQLASFLGIGHLLKTSDLNHLVTFLILFYREHPVDILFQRWVKLMAVDVHSKDRPLRRIPGLFQHIGTSSTLANKKQPLKDNTFSLVPRKYSHINPTADIISTIKQYHTFLPELAYSPAPGMFWGIPKPGDTFDIVFPQAIHLARIYISSGTNAKVQNEQTKKLQISRTRDTVRYGHVEASSKFTNMESHQKASCTNFRLIEYFKDGMFDFKDLSQLFPEGIQCIRIVVDPEQKTWIALTEIAVFTADEIDALQ